jgi:hypothetical protein
VLRLATAHLPESDALQVHILKRRGPPLERAISWPARPARLAVLLAIVGFGPCAKRTESYQFSSLNGVDGKPDPGLIMAA